MPATELARANHSFPLSEHPGFFRTNFGAFQGERSSMIVFHLPPGQRSPVHSVGMEVHFLGLHGSVTWLIEGSEYRIQPYDALYIGPNTEYEYWNSGFETGVLIGVYGRVTDEWPSGGVYPTLSAEGPHLFGHVDEARQFHAKTSREIERGE